MALFESYDRRIDQIIPVLEKYGMKSPSPVTPERMDIKAVSATKRTAESLTRAEES